MHTITTAMTATSTPTATVPVEILFLELRHGTSDKFWALHANRSWAAVRYGRRGSVGQWQQCRSANEAWDRYDEKTAKGYVEVARLRAHIDRVPGNAAEGAALAADIIRTKATDGPAETLLVVPGFTGIAAARPWLAPLGVLPGAAVGDNGTLAAPVAHRFADTVYLTGLPTQHVSTLAVDPAEVPPVEQLAVFAALVNEQTPVNDGLLAAAAAIC